MSDNNKQLVTQAYEKFASGDIGSLLEMMSDHVTWEVPEVLPQGGSFRGRDGVGDFFAGVAREWSDLRINHEQLIADDDHVVAIGTAEGRLADGKAAGYGFSHVFTISDGQFTRFREYAAPNEALR